MVNPDSLLKCIYVLFVCLTLLCACFACFYLLKKNKNTDILFFYHISGGYDKEEKAARAYDLAALKYWGPATTTNIPVRY